MPSRLRILVALISILTLGLGVTSMPDEAVAAGICRASYVVLGPQIDSTGPASTDWFNVFGEDFDPTVPATLTFSVPVIPWSIGQSGAEQTAVSAFVIPTKDMAGIPTNDVGGGGFKWTFRARDPGVQTIGVRIAGAGCSANTVVDFSPPATSTADPPLPGQPTPFSPLFLLLAFAGAVLVGWSWLNYRTRASS